MKSGGRLRTLCAFPCSVLALAGTAEFAASAPAPAKAIKLRRDGPRISAVVFALFDQDLPEFIASWTIVETPRAMNMQLKCQQFDRSRGAPGNIFRASDEHRQCEQHRPGDKTLQQCAKTERREPAQRGESGAVRDQPK